jgi:hypothetical protein
VPAYENLRHRISELSEQVTESGCWLWLGVLNDRGWGERIYVSGKFKSPHKAAYEEYIGPVPGKLQLDHKCRVRCCVNPWHLEPVTAKENLMRGNTLAAKNSAKTHCARGHEFSADNIYSFKTSRGRVCKKCKSENYKKWWAENGMAWTESRA